MTVLTLTGAWKTLGAQLKVAHLNIFNYRVSLIHKILDRESPIEMHANKVLQYVRGKKPEGIHARLHSGLLLAYIEGAL